jgi:hypothetical protein
MDDSYLGGELPGGITGRGPENKIPIDAAVSLNEAGHPIHSRITAVSGFSSEAIADWDTHHLAPGSQVLSDGLACCRSVTTAGCSHEAIVTCGKLPSDLPQFRWINTLPWLGLCIWLQSITKRSSASGSRHPCRAGFCFADMLSQNLAATMQPSTGPSQPL